MGSAHFVCRPSLEMSCVPRFVRTAPVFALQAHENTFGLRAHSRTDELAFIEPCVEVIVTKLDSREIVEAKCTVAKLIHASGDRFTVCVLCAVPVFESQHDRPGVRDKLDRDTRQRLQFARPRMTQCVTLITAVPFLGDRRRSFELGRVCLRKSKNKTQDDSNKELHFSSYHPLFVRVRLRSHGSAIGPSRKFESRVTYVTLLSMDKRVN